MKDTTPHSVVLTTVNHAESKRDCLRNIKYGNDIVIRQGEVVETGITGNGRQLVVEITVN